MTDTLTLSLGDWKRPFLEEMQKELGFESKQEVVYFLLQWLRAELYPRSQGQWNEFIENMKDQIRTFEEVK